MIKEGKVLSNGDYALVNPLPHFLVGDVVRPKKSKHECVIDEVNCNQSQCIDKHQWSYSLHVPKNSRLDNAWYNGDELILIKAIKPHKSMRFTKRRK